VNGVNFFEEAGSPAPPPPAVPVNQPAQPALPQDFAPPPAPAAPAPDSRRVPTWEDTERELPPFIEEPRAPAAAAAAGEPEPVPAVAPATPAPAAAAAPAPPALDAAAIGRAVAEGLLSASAAERQQQEQRQRAQQAITYPQLDREKVMTDPEYIANYVRGVAEASRRQTLLELAPAFNRAEAMGRVGPEVIRSNIAIAQELGAQLAEKQLGITRARFDELVPAIFQGASQIAKEEDRIAFLTNPRGWVMGARYANDSGGVPVTRTNPPPAVGGGGAPAPAPRTSGGTPMTELVERQMKQLGYNVKFTPEDHERIAHNAVRERIVR
jgi:hypothetical protein